VLHDPTELDADPYLLNTPGGTYDLNDGLIGWKPTDPKDLLTKVTTVIPNDEGKELWEQSLDLFFCGDKDLIEYVQKICGMTLVGKVLSRKR